MENIDYLNVLKQALDKATQSGSFTLNEASLIMTAIKETEKEIKGLQASVNKLTRELNVVGAEEISVKKA